MNTVSKKVVKLPGYASLLLVIVLGISLAKLTWLLLTPATTIDTNINHNTVPGSATTVKTARANFGKIISDHHLFGELKKQTTTKTPTKTPLATAPAPTKLNLKLHGIVAYTNKAGFALISSNGGSQNVYGKGDTIEEGVTISDLFPGKVVIDNHGKPEELILPRKSAKNTSNTPSSLLPDNRAAMHRKKFDKTRVTPRAANLARFRTQILKNPEKLLDVATPTPAMVDGEFVGFRLQPGSNRKIFRQIGLRANDIITSVNGIIIDEPSKGTMVLGELSQATSVTLTVQRGAETLTLSHNFSQ